MSSFWEETVTLLLDDAPDFPELRERLSFSSLPKNKG